ncbi:MAG: DUF6398 domain-containing protein, partial [Nitriliruptor sp.]|uniref:IS1096 element passenger TnpR family protein n=1 Tax=Nitriliruptor sp. TaxID=2448056 RepID=UPI0034A03F55
MRPVGGQAEPQEPDLLAEVRDLLAEHHPLPLLTYVSGLLDAVEDPGPAIWTQPAPEVSLTGLVDTFAAVDRLETTALLVVIAELSDDEVLVRRVRRDLVGRDHRLPAWLVQLAAVQPVDARLAAHPLGAFTMVLIGLRTAAGAETTAVVEIDHTLGTVATEGFCYPGPVDVAADELDDPDDPEVTVATIDLADARARIEEAVATGRITVPPFETDTWPAVRPLISWVLRQLPTGGEGRTRPDVNDAERAAITRAFFASPYGRDHDDQDGHGLLDSLLWYGCDYGTGDPLTWSTAEVELLLTDWLPRKIIADAEYLAAAPELLRALIRFGHHERGVSDELTRLALDAVDEDEPEYQDLIRSDRPRGPAALLAAMGVLDDDLDPDLAGLLGDADPLAQHFRAMLQRLETDVGGADALDGLGTAPLPDELFDWERVPAVAREPVGEVLDLADRWCAEVLGDVEVRTVCRRVLADVAATDPGIFTGRGHARTAAAAIAWIVGRANGLFDSWGAGWSIGEMTEWFGVSGSPSQRARRMLQALDVDGDAHQGISLGTSRLLTGERRRQFVQQRDAARAYLGRDEDMAAVLEGLAAGDDWLDPEFDDEDVASWRDVRPQDLDEAFRHEGLPERGADPAPAQPWRTPEPMDVLAVAWFPPEQFATAIDRWPALADRVGTRDHQEYARVVQGTLLDLAREFGRHPVLVPVTTAALEEHAEQVGLDPGGSQARATLAAELDRQGAGSEWPPGRNDPCWCASGRKYKRCCGTVPIDPDHRPVPTGTGAEEVHAYELEVDLAGVKPRIWRRFQIAAGSTFADLHLALQAVCGWENDHLFAFRTADGTEVAGVPFDAPFSVPAPDATTVQIDSYFSGRDHCVYEYDFGDGWVHDIRVVDRITEPVDHQLRLLDGARAFPPEDCGGLPGYHDCLEIAQGGADPHDRAEWLGDWDPEAFDLRAVARDVDR